MKSQIIESYFAVVVSKLKFAVEPSFTYSVNKKMFLTLPHPILYLLCTIDFVLFDFLNSPSLVSINAIVI